MIEVEFLQEIRENFTFGWLFLTKNQENDFPETCFHKNFMNISKVC